MKQNAAVLAYFLGAASAMKDSRGRREDREFDMPEFKGLAPADSCKDDAVNAKFQEVNSSETALEQLETNLTDVLIPAAADKRTLMEAAIADVMLADAAFKATLDADTGFEVEVLRLQQDTMDKKTVLDAAAALVASTQATFDANTTSTSDALTEKTAAENAETKQALHLTYQNDLVTSTKTAWVGSTGTITTAGNGDVSENVPSGGAAQADDAPKSAYSGAVSALVSPESAWSAKVTDISDKLVLKTAANLLKTDTTALWQAVTDSLGPANGSAAGLYKNQQDAAAAITSWAATALKYDAKAALWVTAGKAAINAYQCKVDNDNKATGSKRTTYTEIAAGKACDTASVTFETLTCSTCDAIAKCRTACDLLLPWSEAASTIPSANTHCIGIEYDATADSCKGVLTAWPANTGSADAKFTCESRDLSKNLETYYDNGAPAGTFVSTYVAGLITTANSAWTAIFTDLDTEWTTVLNAFEDADRILTTGTHLLSIYLAKKGTDTDASNTADTNHTNATNELPALLTAANNAGKDPAGTITLNSVNKSMNTLLSEKETAEALTATTKAAYEAALGEQPRQVEMDRQAKAWKVAATTAYDTLENSRLTALTGWETKKTAAAEAWGTANTEWGTANDLYQAEIIKSAVTESASTSASEISAVTDKRDTANSKRDDLNTALQAITSKLAEISGEMATLATKKSEWKALVGTCEVTAYLAFREAYFTAKSNREEKLDKIKELMADNVKLAIPDANGKAGSRCERPRSNGDKRSRVPCSTDDGLCCGAATKTVDGALVTIETCQKSDASKYSYQPKRGPMEITDPEKESWDFACIGGAQRVLAAATAAAGLALMMQ